MCARELVEVHTLDGRAAKAAILLGNEFIDKVFTARFAEAAQKIGFPFRQGKEAADKGQVRLLLDLWAMPPELFLQEGAPTWALLSGGWHGSDPTRDFVVQVMCAVEDLAASHAILLAHADPGQKHCIRPGVRSELLLSLPCGSTGCFPLDQAPFGARRRTGFPVRRRTSTTTMRPAGCFHPIKKRPDLRMLAGF